MANIIDDVVPYSRPAVTLPRLTPLRTAIPSTHPTRSVIGAPAGTGGAGGGGAPAGPPDYMGLLRGSPAYQAWLASRNQRLGGLATNRASSIRQLLLQYGGMPKGFSDSLHDVRPEDMAAAEANQFSITKNIERAYEEGRRAMHGNLAARGMLQSGDLGYGENQASLQRGQQEFDANTNFMNAINEAIGNWSSGSGAVNSEEAGLIANLLPQIREMYPYNPNPAGGGAGGGAGAKPAAPKVAPTRVAAPAKPRPSRPRAVVRPIVRTRPRRRP